jgi:hypothetical protein
MKILFRHESKDYKPFSLEKAATRPNSLKLLAAPSRVANSLIYPDGRRVWGK